MKNPLNNFVIPGAVSIAPGNSDLPRVTLTHESGSSTDFYLYGAHISSWRTPKDGELFFISKGSNWQKGKPIRGGIPICFPQFGMTGPLPQHGFARIQEWTLVKTEKQTSGDVVATLCLQENSETLAIWPHEFKAELRIVLGAENLALALRVSNTGKETFSFTFALHTYFGIADIHQTTVRGLTGVTLIDSLRDRIKEVDERPQIPFDRETDRIYVAAPDELSIRDEAAQRTFSIRKTGLPDAVVWNPWIEKSKRMPDFREDEYLRMVCVETASIVNPVQLEPQTHWEATTAFEVQH